MNVGFTFDLRQDYLDRGYSEEETAEFDGFDTIEAIEHALKKLGFEIERVGNVGSLVVRLAEGKRWDLVFNIAEGLKGFGREAQVPAILDAYDLLYTFSDPLVLSLTLHKGMTKHVVRSLGFLTPDFVVLQEPKDIRKVNLHYPLFAKPVSEGSGKGVSAASFITDQSALTAVSLELFSRFKQPVLVEEFLPGREFTVGVVGTGSSARVVGVMEVIFLDNPDGHVYSKCNKDNYKEVVRYALRRDGIANECARLALGVWKGIGGRDAGRLDIRLDQKGRPHFLEVNPLAGLHPVHSDLPIICGLADMSYDWLIQEIVDSAFKRSQESQVKVQLE